MDPAASQAYRRVMPRLNPTDPPNTALQRTRSAPLRSPLSFEPLAGFRDRGWPAGIS